MNRKVLRVKDLDIEIEVSDSTFKPMRKKPTLAIRQGNQVIKVASFNNLNSAELFIDSLEKMFMQMDSLYEQMQKGEENDNFKLE